MEKVDLSQLISVIAVLSSIVTAWLAVGRGSKNDTKSDATVAAMLRADVSYIRQGVDEIKVDVKRHNKEIAEITTRLAVVEHDIKELKGEFHNEEL